MMVTLTVMTGVTLNQKNHKTKEVNNMPIDEDDVPDDNRGNDDNTDYGPDWGDVLDNTINSSDEES